MAGPKTDSTGQIQPRKDDKSVVGLLKLLGPEIARAVPRHLNPDRLARVVLTAIRKVPELAQCTRESFAGCVMSLAQLGLEPNTPLQQAFLIPRKNSRQGCIECTLIIGYQGMVELSYRSGKVTAIYGHPVYEGDQFAYCYGLAPNLVHIPSAEPGRTGHLVTHAYAVAKITGADAVFRVLDRDELDARRARGGDRRHSAWETDYPEMATKSAIRALWKMIPKSAEMGYADEIEAAPERGQETAEVWSDEVSEALAKHGLLPDAGTINGDGVVTEPEP